MIASFVWRLEHVTLPLDDETVLLVDEAAMTSDSDMVKLLVAAEAAGAEARTHRHTAGRGMVLLAWRRRGRPVQTNGTPVRGALCTDRGQTRA